MSSNNNSYKLWHKPNRSGTKAEGGTSQTHQGYYKVTNREKYIGDPGLIIYRSSWEYSFCKWCDFSESINRWSSEPIKIPYLDKVSKLNECKRLGLDPNNPKNWVTKTYHVDFWIKIQKSDGLIEDWFIEIKPKSKLFKPKPLLSTASLKEQRRFNNAVKEFLINEAKWESMYKYAIQNNSKFFIFTEIELQKFGIIGGKFDLNKNL